MIHATTFKNAHGLKTICILIATVSCNTSHITAINPEKAFCPKSFLGQHRSLAAFIAIASTLALIATPTQGSHEISQELLERDPITWLRNLFGWKSKETKIDSVTIVNGKQEVTYKIGWKKQGIVGAVSDWWKTVSVLGGFMLVLKEVTPVCDTYNFFS